MIVLFTDFGLNGPYTGQMKTVLCQMAPGTPANDLFADAPAGNPKASAYLLAAYAAWFPPGTVFLSVVDPGVGGARPAVIIEADGRWFVGPDNGLFELIQRRAGKTRSLILSGNRTVCRPAFTGATSSHPLLACWRAGDPPPGRQRRDELQRQTDWPDDLSEIVYVDHFGNAMTGLRAAMLAPNAALATAGRVLQRARTFGDRAKGEAVWYENSNGLAEIAVNQSGRIANWVSQLVSQSRYPCKCRVLRI